MAAEKRTTLPSCVRVSTNTSALSGGRCSPTSRDTTRSNCLLRNKGLVKSQARNFSRGISRSSCRTQVPSTPNKSSTPWSLNTTNQLPRPHPTSMTVLGWRNSKTMGTITDADPWALSRFTSKNPESYCGMIYPRQTVCCDNVSPLPNASSCTIARKQDRECIRDGERTGLTGTARDFSPPESPWNSRIRGP